MNIGHLKSVSVVLIFISLFPWNAYWNIFFHIFLCFPCHKIIFLKLFSVLLQYLLNRLCYHLAWKPENSINAFPLLNNKWKKEREVLVLDICKDTKPHPGVTLFMIFMPISQKYLPFQANLNYISRYSSV